jgi:flagellar hook-length control protein FliK
MVARTIRQSLASTQAAIAGAPEAPPPAPFDVAAMAAPPASPEIAAAGTTAVAARGQLAGPVAAAASMAAAAAEQNHDAGPNEPTAQEHGVIPIPASIVAAKAAGEGRMSDPAAGKAGAPAATDAPSAAAAEGTATAGAGNFASEPHAADRRPTDQAPATESATAAAPDSWAAPRVDPSAPPATAAQAATPTNPSGPPAPLAALSAVGRAPVSGAVELPPNAAPADAAVALAGLAVEIAARALGGKRRFEIRLDPPELGRIDVRLDVARDGQVTSRLVVERAETLDLLRRDAPALERALQSAGLKTDASGLEFSLRDHSGGQRAWAMPSPSPAPRPTLLIVPDEDVAVREAVRRGYGILRGLGRGIDIRV